jgi:hypothetical protein
MGLNYWSVKVMIEALRLARKYHLNLIPLHPNSKKAVENWRDYQKKHFDTRELQKYIQDGYNLGVICGSVSGEDGQTLVVIDFDIRRAFEELRELLPGTLIVETSEKEPGWRGRQVYFLTTGKIKTRKVEKDGEELLSIRSEGAYVVAPGSIHPTGVDYIIGVDKPIAGVEPEFFDGLYLKACEVFKLKKGEKIDIKKIIKGVKKGGRDSSLVQLIHWLIRAESDEEESKEKLFTWDKRNTPQLGKQHIQYKLRYHYSLPEPYAYAYVQNPKKHIITDDLTIQKLVDGNSKEKTQAEKMVDLSIGLPEFFIDQYDSAFTSIAIKNDNPHTEVWPVRSRAIKRWLVRLYYEREGSAPNNETLNAALNLLEAKAYFEGDVRELHNRVARREEAIYYDLSNESWEAVKITKDGAEIVSQPFIFRRYSHQKAQATPSGNIDLKELFRFCNINNKDHRLLFLVQLICSFIPNISHPILNLYGAQGSAKSTQLKLQKELVDPSSIGVLSLPRNIPELVQMLDHHYFAPFDNLSSLQKWISDAFCRAVTGDGFSKRQLYTDDDDIIYSFRRCIATNGINLAGSSPDYLDRSINIELERIRPEDRRKEEELLAEFEDLKPSFLGGIFSIISKAMRIKSQLKLTRWPRMADFAEWGEAISQAMGYGEGVFLQAYSRNIEAQNLEAIEGHAIGPAVIGLLEDKDEWEGTASELLSELENQAEKLNLNTNVKSWPKGPNAVKRRLNEIRTNLMEEGIEVIYSRDGSKRTIRVCKTSSLSSYRQFQERLDADDTTDDIIADEIPSVKPSVDFQEPTDDTDAIDDKIHTSPYSQAERLKVLLKIIKRICKENGDAAKDEIMAKTGTSFHATLDQDLEELKKAGFIYEPRPGRYGAA